MTARTQRRTKVTHRGKPRAVLYARVSSKEQEKEGFSIPAQLKFLRAYAESADLVVAQEFIDVETAKQTGRAGFGEIYMDEGIRLLELARRAYELFKKQEPGEKRRLLNFLLSNSTWRDGTLSATFRQPFDMLVVAASSQGREKATGIASDGLFDNWRGRRDSNSRPPA